MTEPLRFTIYGQAQSKANSRELVTIRGQARSIKSKAALAYVEAALLQIPPACRVRMEGEVRMTLRMYYPTQLPDMDETLLLDILQDQFRTVRVRAGKSQRVLTQAGVYRNDRQVRERHVYHFIDRDRPRVEIEVEPRFQPALDL
jgi:Holliday junction resolvase RusA-like endonuclease